ncbi:hypothetical protein [Aminobacter sp. SS-2016]|uniref:hypothetical protein n=1 Tax=Aminobacter sp. Y103A TaxID=1870862 RepID=UPI0025734901|nr:hypothetical protein [Aminobacter sp. SS-2016]
MVETHIETSAEVRVERRCYISSRILTAKTFAEAAPLGIENGLRWVLDVQFKDDQSRLRRSHGATNMAMVRHLALNLIRAMSGKQSIKGKRKLATWDTDYLIAVLQFRVVDPCQHNRRIFAALSSSRYWRKRHRDLDAVSWMDRALFGNRTNPQKYFVGIFVGPRCYCSMPRRLKTNSNFLYLDSASGTTSFSSQNTLQVCQQRQRMSLDPCRLCSASPSASTLPDANGRLSALTFTRQALRRTRSNSSE